MGLLLFILGVFIVLALINLPAFVLSFLIGLGIEIFTEGPFEWVGFLAYSFIVSFVMLILVIIGGAAGARSGNGSTLVKCGVAGVVGYTIGKKIAKL